MNERIKEFAFEARLITVDGITRYALDYEFEKRFAELIVRECIECADMVGKNNLASGYPNSTAHHVKQKIKEHFGVEE